MAEGENTQGNNAATFVGTWLLVSQYSHFRDGRIEPSRGEGALGVLMYDGQGNMSVQLMRTDAAAHRYVDLRSAETAFEGYLAYFGSYEVDTAAQVILHRVVGASYPAYRGTIQHRHYHFDTTGHRLTLQAHSPNDHSTRVLLWQRVVSSINRE